MFLFFSSVSCKKLNHAIVLQGWGDQTLGPVCWSEQSACDQRRNLVRPLFLVIHLGPSGVRALPLTAGINEGGHYF